MRPLVLLSEGAAELRRAGLPSPEADAKTLLAHALDATPVALALIPTVDDDTELLFRRLIELRKQHHPVQHLTGIAYFRGVSLAVGPGVFIPRPETEGLVQLVLDWAQQHPDGSSTVGDHTRASANGTPLAIVDLGTGSGAISKALVTELADLGIPAQIHAVELSAEAYRYAQINLEGTGVDLRLGDLSIAFDDLAAQVDIVVSNPPYIPSGAQVPTDVAEHDPQLALFSGEDGLDAIRGIIPVAVRLLKSGGLLALEHDDTHGQCVPELLRAHGEFTRVNCSNDLSGRARYSSAERA
ncbi:MAG: peptide chain release factor N(5)-glutamine methyltransferase [Propionibacteriaceae bacterium]|jgi:release factor glutamine methyltransferase|nr:peptide chain release factor N(5)-glutamine methyltransferase [Propionibacteriaceae bacterium]